MDRGSTRPNRTLSKEEARRLWARATELQEEARRREEEDTSLLPARSSHADFELKHVRAAAEEAGIRREFMDLAVAEMVAGAGPPDPAVERRVARFLASRQHALEASKIIPAPVPLVLDLLNEVVTRDPFRLTLVDQVGPEVLDGGALIFRAPIMSERTGSFGLAVGYADIREIFVQALPIEDGQATELRVRAPLNYSRRLNYRVGVGLAGVVAAGSGVGAGAGAAALLAGALTGPVGWAVAGAAALAAAVGGGSAGTYAYRRIFRYGMRKGQAGLEDLLRVVAVNVTTRSRAGAMELNAPQRPSLTGNERGSKPSGT